jgi:hypothetical protein
MNLRQYYGAKLHARQDYGFNRQEHSPERIPTALFSSELFATLGVTATRGRLFTPADLVPGQDCVVILSDRFWHRRFDGNLAVLGKHATIDGSSYTVVGILLPDFRASVSNRSVL